MTSGLGSFVDSVLREFAMDIKNIERLIIRCKQGDKKALEELLVTYEPLVKKISMSYFINGYEQEDLEQLGRLAIVRTVNKFDLDNGANFTGFVHRVIKNDLITLMRKRESRMVFPSMESINEEGVEFKEMFPDDFDLEGDFIDRENMDKLRGILDRMKPDDRKLLLMTYRCHGGLKKYAETLGESYFTLRRRKDRLVDMIRKELI